MDLEYRLCVEVHTEPRTIHRSEHYDLMELDSYVRSVAEFFNEAHMLNLVSVSITVCVR